MKITERVKKAVAGFTAKDKNSIGGTIGNDFLKYGNRRSMQADWSIPMAQDRELYTGYMYAAINRIASRGAYLASENVVTVANDATEEAAKKANKSVVHPYLTLIDESPTFSNYQFYSQALRYLNLKGQFYLLAVRAVNGDKVGEIQEFKLLNPYEIERVWNADHTEMAGYRQYKNGMQRDIPKEMVIPIINEWPFDNNESYSTLDAAKETQFTLKQAGDYTRHSLKNNMAVPGIISTDVELPDQQFENFRSRILGQEKGEPIFGNGSGSVKWESMQTNLDEAGLDQITDINRDVIVAVTGVSKTILSIEQSGVTRDTARVQSDLFITDTIMPQLQDILDALNQDYKNNYPQEYEKTGYKLIVESPLGKDIEADIKDTELLKANFALFDSLVAQGYSTDVASKYVEGKIQLEEIGEPTNEPRPMQPSGLQGLLGNGMINVKQSANNATKPLKKVENKTKRLVVKPNNETPQVTNTQDRNLLASARSTMLNAVINFEANFFAEIIKRLEKTYDVGTENSAGVEIIRNKQDNFNQKDIMTDKERKAFENELEFILGTFALVALPIYAGVVLQRRLEETGLMSSFSMNREAQAYLRASSKLTAKSHTTTLINDALKAVQKSAASGANYTELVDQISHLYGGQISEGRANTIARTESTRAYNRSQFEADKQFIEQNELEGQVGKQWVTTSDDPCIMCQAMEARPPIPFDDPFADLGDVLEVSGEVDGKMKVMRSEINYLPIEDGGLHPNCECQYELVWDI